MESKKVEEYPKVKVRKQQFDDEENNYVKSFVSVPQFPLSVKECEDDMKSPVVRIHRSNLSDSTMPIAKGSSKNITKIAVEEDKLNIRASPIPRPRAVLSSPNSDVMIRSKNKKNVEPTSTIKKKNHDNLCENKHHVHCKVVMHPNTEENRHRLTPKKESKAAADRIQTEFKSPKVKILTKD